MFVIWTLAGCLAIAVSALVWWNVRRFRTGRRGAALPAAIRDAVLAAVDRAGAEQGTPVLLLRVGAAPGPDPYSKVGGLLAVPEGPSAPGKELGLDAFLAQVRLIAPPLPEVWTNRVVSLWRGANGVVARCSAAAAPPGAPDAPSATGRGISILRLPSRATGDSGDAPFQSPYRPAFLCSAIPELRHLLKDVPDAAERLLPHILVPGIPTHEIDTYHVSLMGGEPELIQGQHDATCPTCSQPMTFLFQLGDELGLGGDAPVVYVYGCDAHTDQVAAHVDVH